MHRDEFGIGSVAGRAITRHSVLAGVGIGLALHGGKGALKWFRRL